MDRTLARVSRGQFVVLLIVVALVAATAVIVGEWWREGPGLIALGIVAIGVTALALIALDRNDMKN